MEERKKLIATGIDIHGEKHEFNCNLLRLWCPNFQLVSLTIPEGVKRVSCGNNQLKELKLPEGVTHVYCRDNQLTELILPEGVKYLYADKEVPGLEKYMGTEIEIELN